MEAREVIKWLNVCSKNNPAEMCKECPYNDPDYEEGCGKLLADAALLLSAAFPTAAFAEVKIGPEGITAKVAGSENRTKDI